MDFCLVAATLMALPEYMYIIIASDRQVVNYRFKKNNTKNTGFFPFSGQAIAKKNAFSKRANNIAFLRVYQIFIAATRRSPETKVTM